MHGFALNVCGDLAPFNQITPCGIANVQMTSMEKELDQPIALPDVVQSVKEIAQHRFADLRVEETQVLTT